MSWRRRRGKRAGSMTVTARPTTSSRSPSLTSRYPHTRLYMPLQPVVFHSLLPFACVVFHIHGDVNLWQGLRAQQNGAKRLHPG